MEAVPRWSLCWSALELYKPRSAEQLSALRRTREENKDRKWAADFPLFDLAGFDRHDAKPLANPLLLPFKQTRSLSDLPPLLLKPSPTLLWTSPRLVDTQLRV